MKVYFGGWYQRTTLHLSELFDLFAFGKSKLNLDPEKLKSLFKNLDFVSVTREYDYLEYIRAKTSYGIILRYYEDGLYVLEIEVEDVERAKLELEEYYEKCLHPATSYIFSLGAPTPKVLANIKTRHPIVVAGTTKNGLTANLMQVYSKITSGGITVYKTPESIFITSEPNKKGMVENLVDTQIFFREFKDQMEKYLDIHREMWEEISNLRKRSRIKGKEIASVLARLEQYQSTINLISSRINQMTTYVNTRASMAQKQEIEKELLVLFQYKFEGLVDTHRYIQELWNMTIRYLNDSLVIMRQVQAQTLNTSIQSLQVITSLGVLSGIVGYLSRDKLPAINLYGVVYLVGLLVIVWGVNGAIKLAYKNFSYRVDFP